MKKTLEQAEKALFAGEFPVGCIVVMQNRIIVASSRSGTKDGSTNEIDHAEMIALRQLTQLGKNTDAKITLYCNLEPCLMCTGAILLHQIGRVMYGSADHYGGASMVIGHMPTYFEEEAAQTEWIGPAFAPECDKIFERVMKKVEEWEKS